MTETNKKMGFAAMDPEKVKEISSKGGRKAHEMGVAHQFSVEEAREAGKKGGRAPHKSRGRVPGPKIMSEVHPSDITLENE
jgi:general stress protein YciG